MTMQGSRQITRKRRHRLQERISEIGADVASYHQLVYGVIKIKIGTFRDTAAARPHARFNRQGLTETGFTDTFSVSLKNVFEVLGLMTEEMQLKESCYCLKDTWKET
ncbi:hypothetical protein DPMN_024586 [Dreissena polymorpha]|uniref:Uncharacterized protein n=1 Tax=Dreissena polymorpha TaxID=45954 RepID=A0A9D4LPF4_DREPO|nr:hypothetical protein DPMN_024586 [Dreissena polymorpha]